MHTPRVCVLPVLFCERCQHPASPPRPPNRVSRALMLLPLQPRSPPRTTLRPLLPLPPLPPPLPPPRTWTFGVTVVPLPPLGTGTHSTTVAWTVRTLRGMPRSYVTTPPPWLLAPLLPLPGHCEWRVHTLERGFESVCRGVCVWCGHCLVVCSCTPDSCCRLFSHGLLSLRARLPRPSRPPPLPAPEPAPGPPVPVRASVPAFEPVHLPAPAAPAHSHAHVTAPSHHAPVAAAAAPAPKPPVQAVLEDLFSIPEPPPRSAPAPAPAALTFDPIAIKASGACKWWLLSLGALGVCTCGCM
jgi:hypothetical protein